MYVNVQEDVDQFYEVAEENRLWMLSMGVGYGSWRLVSEMLKVLRVDPAVNSALHVYTALLQYVTYSNKADVSTGDRMCGVCYPSVKLLCADASLSKSGVLRCLGKLDSSEYLWTLREHRRSNIYLVPVIQQVREVVEGWGK